MHFHQTQLPNGLQVIAELNPKAQSTAAGFFVRTGSRDETPEVSGVSHFLEHMAFKGDERYTADDINRIFDELGARYNASTSEEVTLFYAAVLPEYLPQTFELLATLITPSLRQDDFDLEKKVILEEIGMYEDLPGFTAYDHVMQQHFSGHPLGNSILGTTESISALTAEQMRLYHADRYKAGNIILAVAGNTTWENVTQLAEEHCGDWPAGDPPRDTTEAAPKGAQFCVPRPSIQQQHVMQLGPAPPSASPLRFAADLLSVIVGDDSGSRLYWDIVDPGYAEAAELSYNDYDGSGTWATYVCSRPEDIRDNLDRVGVIYEEVNRHGVTEEELKQAQNKVSARIVLQSERPMGRLASLGGNWLYRGEYRTVEDDLNVVRSLTTADIRELLNRYPLRQLTTVGVGPLEKLDAPAENSSTPPAT